MNSFTRRKFLQNAVTGAAVSATFSKPAFGISNWLAQTNGPTVRFSTEPRERIAVASYPFREFINGKQDAKPTTPSKMPLKDFAGHVSAKFNVRKIEPWSEHFLSLQPSYLDEIRDAAGKAGSSFANIAADGDNSLHSPDSGERERAIQFGKTWVAVAARLGSPSVRINIAALKGASAKPDTALVAEGLQSIADHAASNNVVVHLENDNPISEDPFFIVSVVDRVNSPWLRALPDFGNSLAALPAEEAYRGLDQMFAHAYAISHVKQTIATHSNAVAQVDLARAFALAAKHNYKGNFSMEFDSAGDPYEGTSKLIAATIKNLS
jgi:sugar phosphate isomerase/epimerase